MKEDMRGLFFIVKGRHDIGGKCDDEDGINIKGYNPFDPNTDEWYMVMDKETFYCFACGSDLKKVLKGVRTFITKFKTRKRYFKHVCEVTSEDYYEVHYLGHSPLTPEQVSKKVVGRCPRVSPAMKKVYKKVYDTYGDYYREEIEEQEDLAYEELKGDTPFNKTKKLVKKTKRVGLKTNTETTHEDTPKKRTLKKTSEKTSTPTAPKKAFVRKSIHKLSC